MWPFLCVFERFDRVAQQVVQNLSHPPHVGFDHWHVRIRRQNDLNAAGLRSIQVDDLMNQLVHAEHANFHIRRACIVAEGINHFLHGFYLLHDGVRRAIENSRHRLPPLCSGICGACVRRTAESVSAGS